MRHVSCADSTAVYTEHLYTNGIVFEQELEMTALLFRRDIFFQSPALDMFVNGLVQHYLMKLAFQVSS